MKKSIPNRKAVMPEDEPGGVGELLRFLERQREVMLQTLRELVEMESPSHDKAAVDRLGEFVAAEFKRVGGQIIVHPDSRAGDNLQVEFPAKAGGGPPILLLGHLDTVWEIGTLDAMPFAVRDGRAWGPGVFDMKSGIAQMIFALTALREVRGGLQRRVTVLLNSDEEVSSESSRALIEGLARRSAAVLVCEPAHGLEGAVKTSRKGVGEYIVRVTGKAAHAGLDYEKGASAIAELARQIARLEEFTDLKRGVTVSVGVIRGGTRTNVIAGEAVAEVDVRIQRPSDARTLERKFRSLKPFDGRCRLEVSGGIERPPMPRSPAVARLYGLAKGVAKSLGMDLREAAVGGGSDGNFTAALGIPTLDGLGGVGEGAHAKHESVLVAELPRRAALLAGLIEAI
ncbi:MAG TPA: M20 family metallopeptidase [Terriglobales bacterium]|nr:M20 family metallopeptidase [Terriglobales bacterium]